MITGNNSGFVPMVQTMGLKFFPDNLPVTCIGIIAEITRNNKMIVSFSIEMIKETIKIPQLLTILHAGNVQVRYMCYFYCPSNQFFTDLRFSILTISMLRKGDVKKIQLTLPNFMRHQVNNFCTLFCNKKRTKSSVINGYW